MLAYEIEGRGPSLLMIHGFGISFSIWKELRPRLRDHFTLIMVELPGIGRTPSPVPGCDYLNAAVEGIEQVREQLGIDSWRVLGFSSGTRVTEKYLALHGEQTVKAAFLCPIRTRASGAAALRTAIDWDRRSARTGNWVLSGWRIRFLINLLGFNLKGGKRLHEWFEEITSQPVDTLKETLRSMPKGGATGFNIPPGVPCVFVWGKQDLITASPREPGPDDRLIRANHSAPQTAAREIAEILIPFLSQGGVSG